MEAELVGKTYEYIIDEAHRWSASGCSCLSASSSVK